MHRVNRIEIELRSGEPALARVLSERVGRMHRERIAPLVDRVCSELSGSEAVDRIDRLELDLGTVAADDLEDAFVARLEPALRAALAKALRRTAGDQRARASLELLETFALTGSLPWWAPHDREIVAHHFARAAIEAGADLEALLRRIAHDPGALDRIARMCDRDALVALVEHAQAGQPLSRGVDREVIAGDEAMAQLPSASSRPTSDTSRPLEERQAPAQDTDSNDGARSADQPSSDKTMAQRPFAASRLTDDAPRGWQPTDPEALDERQARVRDAAGGGASSPLQPAGADVKVQAPSATSPLTSDAAQRRPLADPDALDEQQARARDRATGDAAPPADLPPLHDATPLVERRPPVPRSLAHVQAIPPRMAAGAPRLPPVPAVPAAIRAARRGALARLDELYVADAGLVILWPFLEPFFLRTGVLGPDRRFVDEAAQLQAVALVEGLATADPAPLEFHLPLAKLLCGRAFESDFVLERPLAPEQLAEADRLLAAVIDRTPVAHDLSIASFRAGFLARPGALGTRDGAWLLQVERRPHDAVLDRFPWSWGWIKLPWMPEPLRVDW